MERDEKLLAERKGHWLKAFLEEHHTRNTLEHLK